MIETVIETLGDAATLALAGALVGVFFGVVAQRSRFCLRAATVEVADGEFGPSLAVWLIAFTTAVFLVQGAVFLDWLDLAESRAISSVGSMSGAVIGGLMFGAGMILARGCASRLLVLASGGNLRALLTGLVVTLVAQASFRGVLSPAREAISGWWTIPGGDSRDVAALLRLSDEVVLALSALALLVSLYLGRRCQVPVSRILASAGVGLAVALGWVATFTISQTSFEVVPISSITFTGPATDTLMALVSQRNVTLSFGIGLVPGVAIGAAAAAFLAGEWQIQRFGPENPMERYLVGAVFMGFGAMLAGGCAVGAGLSGGSALSLTALIAALSMWVGAIAMHLALADWSARQG